MARSLAPQTGRIHLSRPTHPRQRFGLQSGGGPYIPTTTKQTSSTPVGLDGVRCFRALAGPDAILVAAADITLETAPTILDAGANSVAVSAAIFRATHPAAELRRWLDALV